MHGRSKRRSNIFKLGRRGRRGRVPFDVRWGPVPSRSSNVVDAKSRLPQLTIDNGSESLHSNVVDTESVLVRRTVGNRPESRMEEAEDIPGAPTSYENAGNEKERSSGVITLTKLQSSGEDDHEVLPLARSNEVVNSSGHALSSSEPRTDAARGVSNYTVPMDEQDVLDIPRSAAFNEDSVETSGHEMGRGGGQDFESQFAAEEITSLGNDVVEQNDSVNGDMVSGAPVLNNAVEERRNLRFADNDAEDERQDTRTWSVSDISSCFKKISLWQNLLSVVVVSGSVRFSVREFEVYRKSMNSLLEKGFPTEQKLPAYSTVSRTLLPLARSWCFARSMICTAEMDSTKAGSREGIGIFVVVKPSTWSVLDVSCPQTWKILRTTSQNSEMSSSKDWFEVIESTPILRCRERVLNTLPGLMTPINHDRESPSLISRMGHDYLWSVVVQKSGNLPTDILGMLSTPLGEDIETSTVVFAPIQTVLVTNSATACNVNEAQTRALSHGVLPHSQLRTEVRGLWEAGDYCTSVKPRTDSRYLFVLVHHHTRPGRVSRRIGLVFIPYDGQNAGESDCCVLLWGRSRILSALSVTVAMQNPLYPERSVPSEQASLSAVPAYGRLQNGLSYFIDRTLLYSDRFSQYKFKQGSAGGVYSVSLNYPPHLRRSRERVRVLTLTPPGVSTNEGLRAVLDDLVTMSTEGVKVRNADGEDMILFIDVIGYVCDYCEVRHVLDVVGHNGSAPCHLCSFLRFEGHESTGSQYCNTTDTHAGNARYASSGPRTEAIRASGISDKNLVSMGLKTRPDAEAQRSPLFEYYKLLREQVRTATIPLTEFNRPVVGPGFDPYLSVLVAPDHLLAGIAINELTLAFKALPTPARRVQADAMICQELRRNGLLEQSTIFNCSASIMHTTSISGTFCTLVVAVPVFFEIVDALSSPDEMDPEELEFVHRILRNLRLFRKLVSSTYWFPRRHVDDPNSVAAFNRDEGMGYISYLQNMCMEYITECNEICKLSPLATKHLDKPNAHRLLELYNHSIPALGHVHHFAELVFECAHQPLKKAMGESNFHDTHLQSVKHSIADDWKGRLAAAFGEGEAGNDEGIASILNVLTGRQDEIRKFVAEDEKCKDRTKDLLQNELMKNVVGSIPKHLDGRTFKSVWRLTERSDKLAVTMETSTTLAYVMELVDRFLIGTEAKLVRLFEKASRLKVWGSGQNASWSHSRAHDTLTRGNVVQALISNGAWGVLTPSSKSPVENGNIPSIHYFAIEALFQDSDKNSYAAVRECVVNENGLLIMEEGSYSQVLMLNDSVRRICVVHACHGDPKLRCLQRNVTPVNCTASILRGSTYYFFNREQGYPPRMA